MMQELVAGQACSVLFTRSFSLFATISATWERVDFPAHVRFDNCIFQEAYYDPYAGLDKYVIQVPIAGKVWTIHIVQHIVRFVVG